MTDTAHDDTDAAEATSIESPAEMHGCPMTDTRGQVVLYPSRDQYLDVVKALADEGFAMCVDLCGVDYLTHADRALPADVQGERFEIVVNLLDIADRRRLRLRVQVPESDPTLASLFDVHPGTEAMEREAYDMFGVEFTDHPDPSRILMPEDWIGHPLRKDYDVGEIPVQFKGANS